MQTVLKVLAALVRTTNKYMAGQPLASADAAPAPAGWTPVPYILRSAADFVTSMFRVFGLVDAVPGIGFGLGGAAAGGASLEETLAPYLDVLAAFRETGALPTAH